MQEALLHFGLTALHQEKEEILSDWFRSKHIDGEPLLKNLVDAMLRQGRADDTSPGIITL